MDKTIEQEDEEFFMSIRDTVDDMFTRMFPTKMFCEAEDAEIVEDFEDVVDEEEDDDQE